MCLENGFKSSKYSLLIIHENYVNYLFQTGNLNIMMVVDITRPGISAHLESLQGSLDRYRPP